MFISNSESIFNTSVYCCCISFDITCSYYIVSDQIIIIIFYKLVRPGISPFIICIQINSFSGIFIVCSKLKFYRSRTYTILVFLVIPYNSCLNIFCLFDFNLGSCCCTFPFCFDRYGTDTNTCNCTLVINCCNRGTKACPFNRWIFYISTSIPCFCSKTCCCSLSYCKRFLLKENLLCRCYSYFTGCSIVTCLCCYSSLSRSNCNDIDSCCIFLYLFKPDD